MSRTQKDPLRELTQQEEQALERLSKSTSERVDVVKRAKALLLVKAGKSYIEAAKEVGYKSNDSVSHLVSRFNKHGPQALCIAAGRGRKPTYTSVEQAGILREVQREPDRKADQTATWSLSTLQQALRKKGLPRISKETIRQVLTESGYSYQRTRTWCHTGYAERKRKSGTVTIYDEQTAEKKRRIELACEQAEAAGIVQMNEDEAGPYQAIPYPGASWEPIGHPGACSLMSMNGVAPLNC
jgi:transposase